jgi:hypothetical protein
VEEETRVETSEATAAARAWLQAARELDEAAQGAYQALEASVGELIPDGCAWHVLEQEDSVQLLFVGDQPVLFAVEPRPASGGHYARVTVTKHALDPEAKLSIEDRYEPHGGSARRHRRWLFELGDEPLQIMTAHWLEGPPPDAPERFARRLATHYGLTFA